MILKVNKDSCEIKENEIWNVGDYNVHTVNVELSSDFNGLVNKVRYFVEDNCYDELIVNNIAQVPYEATLTEGTIKIGVYGFDADTNILVQSTAPVNKFITSGTYTGNADNTEPLTPTDKQQMESAIQQNTDDITDLKANKQDKLISGVNIKTINNESILGSGNIEIGGGGGGTSNYNALTNKPKINNVELNGNKTSSDLGLQPAGNYALKSEIPDVSNFITKDVNNLTYYTLSSELSSVATSGSYNDLTNKPTIPSEVTETTVSNWGFTKNIGTITGITMNGVSKGTSGVVDLGTVITSHQDISGKANKISVVQTSASTIEINSNTFYKFGEVASLNITLASITDNTIYNEYMFEFVSGTTATTLTLPSSIKWLETPTIDANKIYQCSIVDNVGLLVGVTNV